MDFIIDLLNSILESRLSKVVIGFICLVLSIYFLFKNVYVSTGRFAPGIKIGILTIHSGILTIPLILALVWLFFRPNSKAAKTMAVLGIVIIVLYIIFNVNIRVARISLFKWIGIIFLMVVGVVLLYTGLFDKKIRIKR